MKKSEIIKQLSKLGIKVEGNYIRKKDIKRVLANVKDFEFLISDPGDPSVGMWGREDSVKVSFGEGIDPNEVANFNEAMSEFLGEYFDCPPAITKEKYDRMIREEREQNEYELEEMRKGEEEEEKEERERKHAQKKGRFKF